MAGMTKHPDNDSDTELRRQAEEIVKGKAALSPDDPEAMSPAEARLMLHELRVHQIELEMQNEELRRVQVELDAERARYFDLYDLAPVGYCTLSAQGLILEANFTAATLLGVARRELVKRPISRFIVKTDQDIYYLLRKQLLDTGAAQSCELQMVKHDGTPFWAHLTATDAQDAEGARVHRLVLSDVTAGKLMAAAMQEKNAELERAKSVAEKANRAKSDFLSSMSHELRSPLNAILGFAQLMASGLPPPTPRQEANLGQILKAGWYLLELINEILDLALIESGKLSLSLEPIALPDVLLDCQAMMEPQAQKNGIRISFPAVDRACFVEADRTRLKQVLINLLSNAIKYNRAGGTVDVTCSMTPAQRVRISVQDSGEGLSPENLAQLFQPFNRLGRESSAEEGTGIGLVVSQRLLDLMGGDIGVETTAGVGSVFWIELNRAAAPPLAAFANASLAPLQTPAQQGVALRTLLYVEDNRVNMELVEQLIARRPDMRLLGAADGTRGIALARTHQPALILMDINLPGMSGIEALKILRADPATQRIPVLALSANAMPRDIEQGLAAGFFRYLTKPIKVTDFMEALDMALEFVQTQSAREKNEMISQ